MVGLVIHTGLGLCAHTLCATCGCCFKHNDPTCYCTDCDCSCDCDDHATVAEQ